MLRPKNWNSVAFFIPCSQTTHVILPLSSLSLDASVRLSRSLLHLSSQLRIYRLDRNERLRAEMATATMIATTTEEKGVPRAPSTTFPYSLPAPKPLRQFDERLDLSSLSLSDFDLDGLNALSAINSGRLGLGEDEEEGVLNLGVEELEGGDGSDDDDDDEISSLSSSVTEVPRSYASTPAGSIASTSKGPTVVLPPSPSESTSTSSSPFTGASHPHHSHASPSLKRSRRRSYPSDESHDLEWDCGIWYASLLFIPSSLHI